MRDFPEGLRNAGTGNYRGDGLMKKDMVIGVLGGMGTYATIHLFEQYAELFPAEKEWERPRILIDNRCTMPSRVRAFLFHEKVEQLREEMTDSLIHLSEAGANRILLACNTSHLFLPDICEKHPELREKIVHIVECCCERMKADGIQETYLLGSEGTIDSGIYQEILKKQGIGCSCPGEEEYGMLRDCIEAVKQKKYSDDIKKTFLNLINRTDACILGCTELPILYEMYRDEVTCRSVYDPLLEGLRRIKEEYENG